MPDFFQPIINHFTENLWQYLFCLCSVLLGILGLFEKEIEVYSDESENKHLKTITGKWALSINILFISAGISGIFYPYLIIPLLFATFIIVFIAPNKNS